MPWMEQGGRMERTQAGVDFLSLQPPNAQLCLCSKVRPTSNICRAQDSNIDRNTHCSSCCKEINSVSGALGLRLDPLAQHNGWRIQHCRSCSWGCNGGLDLIPDPGTPYAVEWRKQKKKNHWPVFSFCSPHGASSSAWKRASSWTLMPPKWVRRKEAYFFMGFPPASVSGKLFCSITVTFLSHSQAICYAIN